MLVFVLLPPPIPILSFFLQPLFSLDFGLVFSHAEESMACHLKVYTYRNMGKLVHHYIIIVSANCKHVLEMALIGTIKITYDSFGIIQRRHL